MSWSQVAGIYRLRGPKDEAPEVSSGQTPKQGGACAGQPTRDLLLTFAKKPDEWLAGLAPAIEEAKKGGKGPCEMTAAPLADGRFEVRLSYRQRASDPLKTLVFSTSDAFVVDHWFEKGGASDVAATKKKTPKAQVGSSGALSSAAPAPSRMAGTLLDIFEDQKEWDKILKSQVTAYDFNSPDLDRFRYPDGKEKLSAELDYVERRPLSLPHFDLPSMDRAVEFVEEDPKLADFGEEMVARVAARTKSQELKKAAPKVVEAMNLVVVLSRQGKWLRAQKAIDVITRSDVGRLIPTDSAAWWALRGLVQLRLAKELGESAPKRRALDIWRDGLKLTAGAGGVEQAPLEYMLLETTRHLMVDNLPYAAASLLTWAEKFSWSQRVEERFAFLRGEAYLMLGLYPEAREAFGRFYNSRSDRPLTASIDRRLVPAAAFRLADIEMRAGDTKKAVELYTKAISNVPTMSKFSFEGHWFPDEVRLFPHVLFNRAEVALREGQYQVALKDLRGFVYIVPNHPKIGLVYFRIGDILDAMGAPRELVMNAWAECLYRVPNTLGARLCEARKSGRELEAQTNRSLWPRLIGQVEQMKPLRDEKGVLLPAAAAAAASEGVRPDDLEAYAALILAEAFIKQKEPRQALFWLDPLANRETSQLLRVWGEEYSMTAFAGVLEQKLREGRYKEIIEDYELRKSRLFHRQTRPEVLWRVAAAYEKLGLDVQALGVLEQGVRVRQAIARVIPRPYEPSELEWMHMRARLEVNLLAQAKLEDAKAEASLKRIGELESSSKEEIPVALRAETARLWARFAEARADAKLAAKWWKETEKIDALSWADVKKYSAALEAAGLKADRAQLLEKRVGLWFADRDNLPESAPAPAADLLIQLVDVRESDPKGGMRALAVLDHLSKLPKEKLGPLVPPALVHYRRGQNLAKLGRFDDARRSFDEAKRLEPDGVWGRLAATADKELVGKTPASGSR